MRRIEFTVNEQQLTKLIKQMVREAKDEMEMGIDLDMKHRGNRFDLKRAVAMAAEIFERDFADDMSNKDLEELEDASADLDINRAIEKLENKSEDVSPKGEDASDKIDDMLGDISESFLNEGKFDRIKSIIARANIFGGLGVIGTAGTAFVSMIPGYVDFEFLTKVHDMVESVGCSRYCGPLSFFVACLGVAMFFHGMSRKDYLDSEMARKRGGDEEVDESYYY